MSSNIFFYLLILNRRAKRPNTVGKSTKRKARDMQSIKHKQMENKKKAKHYT